MRTQVHYEQTVMRWWARTVTHEAQDPVGAQPNHPRGIESPDGGSYACRSKEVRQRGVT
jgi:hypothetical protein